MEIKKRRLLGITVVSLTILGMAGAVQVTSITGKAEVTTSQHSERATLPNPGLTVSEITRNNGTNPFRDISGSSFKDYIQWVYAKGITTGFTPTTYNPKGKVTRGEMAVFLWRLAGSPSYSAPFNVYNDVTLFKNQILWLTAVQVTTGTAPRYNPNGNVTRGQMAAFMHRVYQGATGKKDTTKYPVPYADSKNHMFANNIGWLKEMGITDTPTSFRPDASVTREEMAAFLKRFYGKIPKNYANVTVKNTTLKVGDKWDKKNNFVSAKDANGKAVDFSKVTVSGNVNTSKPGTNTVTYSYGGKSAKAMITVKSGVTLELNPAPTDLYEGDTWDAKSLIKTVTDADGKSVDPSAVTIEDNVKPDTAGDYKVTYKYGGLTKTSTVTVKKNQTAIALKTSSATGYQYVTDRAVKNAFVADLIDKDGNTVPKDPSLLDKVSLGGNWDREKEGTYELTLSYAGVTETVEYIVSKNNRNLEVSNSMLYIGDSWTAADNFVSAKNYLGNDIGLGSNISVAGQGQITITGEVNTNIPDTYPITYTYNNYGASSPLSETAMVTVKEKQDLSELKLKSTDITLNRHEMWNPMDNIATIKDEDGLDIGKDLVDITSNVKDLAGTYKVTYKYGIHEVSATVKVVDPNAPKSNSNGTFNFMGYSWSGIKDLGNGNHLVVLNESIGKKAFNSSTVNYYQSNAETALGYMESSLKQEIDMWFSGTVLGDPSLTYADYIQPVQIPEAPYSWARNAGLYSNSSGSFAPGNWESLITRSEYATTTGSGQKRAFLLSPVDVIEPGQSPVTLKLSTETKDFLARLQGNTMLRSIGLSYNSTSGIFYDSTRVDSVTAGSFDVCPAIVIYVPS